MEAAEEGVGRFIAQLPWEGLAETEELSVAEDDLLRRLPRRRAEDSADEDPDHLWLLNERSGESGLVPRALVRDIATVPEDRLPYFHPHTSLAELLGWMKEAGEGSFFLRPSTSQPSHIVLFLHAGPQAQKFLIERGEDGALHLGGRAFGCLDDIVERYRRSEIFLDLRLRKPVLGSRALRPASSRRRSLPKLYWRAKEGAKWRPVEAEVEDGTLVLERGGEGELRLPPEGRLFVATEQSVSGRQGTWELVWPSGSRSFWCPGHGRRLWRAALEDGPSSSASEQPPTQQRLWIWLKLRETKEQDWTALAGLTGLTWGQVYLQLDLHGVPVAKTLPQSIPGKGPLVWDEEFRFQGLLTSGQWVRLSISLWHKRRGGWHWHCLGRTDVREPDADAPQETHSLTLELSHDRGPVQVRAEILCQRVHVMRMAEYAAFVRLLEKDNFAVVVGLGKAWKGGLEQGELGMLIRSLLRLFWGRRVELAAALGEAEVERCAEPRTLFRAPTLGTAVVGELVAEEGKAWLASVLAPVLPALLQHREVLAGSVAQQLPAVAASFADAVLGSRDACPGALQRLFALLGASVRRRWPDQAQLPSRAVALFLFLRLICLGIVEPGRLGLLQEPLSEVASRNTVSVAKWLQAAALAGDDESPPSASPEPEPEVIGSEAGSSATSTPPGDRPPSQPSTPRQQRPIDLFVADYKGPMRNFITSLSSGDGAGDEAESEEASGSAWDAGFVFSQTLRCLEAGEAEAPPLLRDVLDLTGRRLRHYLRPIHSSLLL